MDYLLRKEERSKEVSETDQTPSNDRVWEAVEAVK